MPRTKTSSSPDMADGVVLDELELYFKVMPNDRVLADSSAAPPVAVVANVEDVKLREKVYAQTRLRVANDVDSAIVTEVHAYEQLSVANFPEFTQVQLNQLFAGLNKVFKQHRANKDLDPVV